MNRLSAPLDVQIEITSLCNEKCRHCYNYWRYAPIPNNQELDVTAFSQIINQVHDAKVGQIIFTGGEPLIRKNVLIPLIKLARSYDIDVGLNSNAVFIDSVCAQELASSGLKHALISFLGPEGVHNHITGPGGDFQKTSAGIKNLLAAGISVAVNMVVSNINVGEIFATAKLAKDLGVSNFCAGPAVPACKTNVSLCLSADECKLCLRELIRVNEELSMNIDVLEPLPRCMFTPEEDNTYARFFGNRMCSAAVSSCAISSTGQMRPCIQADVSFGNVMTEGFLPIWAKMGTWASPDILPKKCRTCVALMVCEGGCRMSAKVTGGDYSSQDMYMTEPITEIDRVKILPKQDPCMRFTESDLFEYNHQCIIRKEQNSYVACSGGLIMHLTEKGFNFINLLRRLKIFSISSLASEVGHTEDMLNPILQRLLETNVIKRTTTG